MSTSRLTGSKEVTTHYPPRRFPVQSYHPARSPPLPGQNLKLFGADAPPWHLAPDHDPTGWQPIAYSRCPDRSESEQPPSHSFQVQPTSLSTCPVSTISHLLHVRKVLDSFLRRLDPSVEASKKFDKSMSTAMRSPAWVYSLTFLTASSADNPGQNP
jgi:hypothetical protein